MKIISNTTPIISLIKVNKLNALSQLFGEVYISTGIYEELITNEVFKQEAEIIKRCDFIKIVSVNNEFAVKLLQKNLGLDLGESEAIVLCDELKGDLLIIDEKKARKVAKSMFINITGTLGVLLKCKEKGYITEMKPILDTLIKCNIRISESLYDDILKHAREK